MSKIRALPIVAVLLGSAACFAPPQGSSSTDDPAGSTAGDVGDGETGEPTATSGHDPTGDAMETDGSATGSADASTGTPETTGSGCTPGVFGRSVFDGACFQ